MRHPLIGAFALMTIAHMSSAAAFAAAPDQGDAANPAYMWDLSDLYPTPADWTAEHA